MAQIFCQSKLYRDLTLRQICSLSDAQAFEKFVEIRWGSRKTVICPECGEIGEHPYRRTRRQWRCKSCDAIFSVTSRTALANRRLPYKDILMAAFIFVASPKSEAANKTHAILGNTIRTTYLLFGKLREALWEQRDTTPLRGLVHIDGGHFCGKPRRPRRRQGITSFAVNSRLRNRKASIAPPRAKGTIEPWNLEKLKNRRVVLVLREISQLPRIGATRTRVVIVKAETAENVINAIRANVDSSATIMTDESPAYARLSAWYDHRTVKHSAEYATDDGVNQNHAESYIARLRRAEYGVFHGMRHRYFALYAHEIAWREDMRRKSLEEKFNALLKAVLCSGWSKAWRGYNQGHRLRFEFSGLPGAM